MIKWTVQPSPEFQDIEIEIANVAWINGTVSQLRLDPGDFRVGNAKNLTGQPVTTAMDYFSFKGKPELAEGAVDIHGKVTTTWGRLKQNLIP